MRQRSADLVPSQLTLMWPTLSAVRELGGSATIQEITEKVVEIESLSEGQQSIPHGEGLRSELEYRLAWARTYLKKEYRSPREQCPWCLERYRVRPQYQRGGRWAAGERMAVQSFRSCWIQGWAERSEPWRRSRVSRLRELESYSPLEIARVDAGRI